jgi:crotonobetainyl-CoA:carnitine CoA-transferase CaiB-like acyl-CoA transferase
LGTPFKFAETPMAELRSPPYLGEHTDTVLQNLLDLDDSTLDELRRRGVIKSHSVGEK